MIPVIKKQPPQNGVITFEGFPQGLNTSVPAEMITKQELAECVDWKYNSRGQLETRAPIVKYTDTATTGDVKTIGHAIIGGTARTLIGDDDKKVYYVGGVSGYSSTLVDTVSGVPEFLSYNNVCLVFDGSYVKYMDSVTEVKLCYDTEGTIVDNYSGDDDGAINVSAGGVGCAFTTPAWDAGFTIPPVTVTAKVVSTGASTLTATIYDVVDTSNAAVTTYTGEVPDAANFIDITFAASDITAELKPNTLYHCLLKGANVDLQYTTVASGGTMVGDATKTPIIRINPGLPPKAKYGVVSDKRPFLWGDTATPGQIPYGKFTHLEWGYLTTIDESKISYPVGGLEDLYGDLWVYGTQDHPYLATLTGDTESDWAVAMRFQRAWSLPTTLENIGNDLFNGASDGIDSLSGVQEYGDVRSNSESDKIFDKISNYWSSSSFAGYYPKDGQYWLYMPGYSKVLVCHTKRPVYTDNKRYFPWTEYTLPITPTYFKQAGDNFLIGCGDGYLYTIDETNYKDLTTTQIEPTFKTAYIEFPFNTVDLEQLQFIARSLTGCSFDIDIYVNGKQDESVHTYSFTLPMSDALTVDDMTMDVDDAVFLVDPVSSPPWLDLNINVRSFQIEISNLQITGKPIFNNGMFIKYRQVG